MGFILVLICGSSESKILGLLFGVGRFGLILGLPSILIGGVLCIRKVRHAILLIIGLPKDPKATNNIKLNKRKIAAFTLFRIGLISAAVGLFSFLICHVISFTFSGNDIPHTYKFYYKKMSGLG